FEGLDNLTLEVVNNGLIEFEYDFYQICFDKLLEGVNYLLVAKNTIFIKPPVQTAVKAISYKQLIKGTLLGLAQQEPDNDQIIESDQNIKSYQNTESNQNTKNNQDIQITQLDV
ncbi:3194_t:CDS:2, partial [Racocetra fulgida]